MARDATLYASMRGGGKAFHHAGFDASVPVAGHYLIRLGAGTVKVAVIIWHGPPHDPVTGEELDRSWRWQARLDDGEVIDIERVWPACAKEPVSEREFQSRCGRRAWAQQNAPDSAYADRRKRYDPLDPDCPLPF